MKKRILSIALAVVMVVAMVPVAMISAFAAHLADNGDTIDTYYTDVEITVDGQRDAIYAKSEMTTTEYVSGKNTGFEGYFVATADGLYFYADIIDTTIGYEYMQANPKRGAVNDVSNHDKIQVYYHFAGTWGYVEFDYFYNNADATFLPGDLEDATPLHHARFRHVGKGLDTNAVESYFTAATTVDLEAGKWTAEFFLPWDVADHVDGSAAPYEAGVGVQVNNDNYNADGTQARDGYCYNARFGTGWWQGPGASTFIGLNYHGVDVVSTANGKYKAQVTTSSITLDGEMDDIYLQSDALTNSEYIYKDKSVAEIPAYTGFKAYTAATYDGFYVYLDVNDETMNNIPESDTNALGDGDRVQFYLDWTPAGYRHDDGLWFVKGTTRVYESTKSFDGGWIGVDYNGNIGTTPLGGNTNFSTIVSGIDFEIVKRENPDWDGSDPKTQYVGYIVEMFIPWTPWMANAIGSQELTHFGFGVEVQDDCTYDDGGLRGIIIGNEGFLSYYSQAYILPDIVLDYDTAPVFLNSHYGAKVETATVDGVNTDGEYDGAQVIHVNKAGGGTADDGDIYRIITDGKSVYVLCEMVDTTPSDHTTKLGTYYDYCDIFFSFGTRLATYASFYRDYFSKSETGEMDPVTWEPLYKYSYANVRGGYNGGSIAFHPDLGNFAVVDNREAGWSFELKFDLTAKEQAQLAAGTFEFAMAAQYLDGTTENADGRNFKYDMANAGDFWNLRDMDINRFHPVKFVDSDLMDVEADLTGAQVALGESISVNFFADLSVYDTDAKLKVTFNGKEYVLGAQKTDVANEYKFVFEGIAPQCMGDLLDAELIVDGVVVESITDYSVRQNCLNIIDAGADLKTQQLIADLAAYGAAAQLAANYKTDDLVNAGFEGYATEITAIENNDKTVSEAVEGFEFTAAGVYFDNTNKIYVKAVIDAELLDYVTVTIDGVEATLIATGNENEYIVYTDDIVVTDFDKVYTFVITDDVDSQTVTYSVNAYCAAKIKSAKYDTTKALVAATYAYGLSAEAYVA